MAYTSATVVSVALVLCVLSAGAFADRQLLQMAPTPAPAPGEGGKVFDFGRPCTLAGNISAESQITGPNNAACTNCGSGSSAVPDATCTFKPIECTVGSTVPIAYHSSVHQLFIGAEPCAFTTEVCPNATAAEVNFSEPCEVPCTSAGTFYISDRASEYCTTFSAYLPLTVLAA